MSTSARSRRSVVIRAAAAIVLLSLAATGFLVWHRHHDPTAPTANANGFPKVPRSEAARVNGLLCLKGRAAPFTGTLFENYTNGSRKLEIEVRNGKLNGHTKGWYPDGQAEIDETFANDLSEGTRTRWYPNGRLKSTATIRQGQLQGPYTEWHDNGQKAAIMTLLNGQPQGTAESWHPSGALKSRSTLDHGKILTQQFFNDPATAQAKTP